MHYQNWSPVIKKLLEVVYDALSTKVIFRAEWIHMRFRSKIFKVASSGKRPKLDKNHCWQIHKRRKIKVVRGVASSLNTWRTASQRCRHSRWSRMDGLDPRRRKIRIKKPLSLTLMQQPSGTDNRSCAHQPTSPRELIGKIGKLV